METTRLSSKGQVIIPKWLRELYHWESGLEFVIIDTGRGVLLKPHHSFEPTTLDEVTGSLPYSGEPRTIEEMDTAIQRAIAEGLDDSD